MTNVKAPAFLHIPSPEEDSYCAEGIYVVLSGDPQILVDGDSALSVKLLLFFVFFFVHSFCLQKDPLTKRRHQNDDINEP